METHDIAGGLASFVVSAVVTAKTEGAPFWQRILSGVFVGASVGLMVGALVRVFG